MARASSKPHRQKSAPRLTREQRLSWLRLIRSENVGPATFRALVNEFGGAEAAIDALPLLSRRGGRVDVRLCSEAEAADGGIDIVYPPENEEQRAIGERGLLLSERSPGFPPRQGFPAP